MKKALLELAEKLRAASAKSSPEDIQKIIKNAQESVPPSVVGQGSNLDALRRAKVGAPDLDVPAGYPKNIVQDDLAIPKEPMTKDFVMVPEGSRVPALIPDEILDVPINNTLQTVIKGVSDIPKKEFFSPSISTSYKNLSKEAVKKMDPRLQKILALSGIVTAGYMGSGEDEPSVQIPMAREQAIPQYPADAMDAGAEDEASRMTQMKNAPKQVTPAQRAIESKEVIPQPSEPESIEERLLRMVEDGQKQSEKELDSANLLRAGENIAAGFMYGKADNSGSDRIRKEAGRFEDRAKQKSEAVIQDQKLRANQKDLNDTEKLRDINSDISKTARELAKKLGINVTDRVSAKQLQDAGLPLGTLLSTQMAAESRREMAALARESKSESKEKESKFKVQGSVDKQVAQLYKSKDYEAYNAAKDAVNAVEAAILSGDKTASGSAFMLFAKIAQGDNSVVRDGDMAVLAGSYNYTSPSEMISKLAAKARGGNFNEQELKQMKAVAARTQQIKGERVQRLMSPIVKRADEAGLDLTETLDPATVEEFKPKQEAKAMKLQSAKKPGTVITTKSGKSFKVNADGMTATEL